MSLGEMLCRDGTLDGREPCRRQRKIDSEIRRCGYTGGMNCKRIFNAIVTAAVLSVVVNIASFAQDVSTVDKPQTEKVYHIGTGVTPPKMLMNVDPAFTEEALRNRISGIVLVSLIVGEDGRTRDIRVERGLGYGLDQAAVEAVQKWTFEPGRLNGAAVPVTLRAEIRFAATITPRLIQRVDPEFARPTHGLRVKGKLDLSLTVDEKGLPTNIKIEHSQGRRYDEEAIAAVRQWRFEPGKRNGIAVPMPYDIEFLRF